MRVERGGGGGRWAVRVVARWSWSCDATGEGKDSD
uniref:Uncharacterized protein n=1 Tax=Arundo donax TaxID=35708 RepID=A0A0A9F4R1_ARUDO